MTAPRLCEMPDEFVRNRVDLVIEFQIDQHVAPVLADKIDAAGIPLIAVDIPHPHATFFGVNNYRVGFEAGECLAQYAKRSWGGKVRWALGLDIEEAGPLVRSRVTGAFEAIRSRLPGIPPEFLVRMDARGLREKSCQLVSDFLRRHPKDRGILIAAATDTSALGAVQAVRELKREKHVAIVGQDCIPEALEEISARRQSADRLRLARSPELRSAADSSRAVTLSGHRVAPYNYVEHKLVTGSWSGERQERPRPFRRIRDCLASVAGSHEFSYRNCCPIAFMEYDSSGFSSAAARLDRSARTPVPTHTFPLRAFSCTSKPACAIWKTVGTSE